MEASGPQWSPKRGRTCSDGEGRVDIPNKPGFRTPPPKTKRVKLRALCNCAAPFLPHLLMMVGVCQSLSPRAVTRGCVKW